MQIFEFKDNGLQLDEENQQSHRLLKNHTSCILNSLQRYEYQERREEVLEVLQMTDTGLNFICKDRKRSLENVVWKRKKDMNKT